MTNIFEYFRTPITLRRPAKGSYVNGIWVEGQPTDFQITASIQPINAEEMQSLPLSRRQSESYKMFTATEINTVEKAGSDQNADRILFNGKEFEVNLVNPWQNNPNFNIVNHYEYFIMRIDNN